MSTPRHRSHEGCWTCKARRRKCDGGRPTCENCQQRGILCEGYEVRLRWGTGIASRGRFTGADRPVGESVPARRKGRRRDVEKTRTQGAEAVDRDWVTEAGDRVVDVSGLPDLPAGGHQEESHLDLPDEGTLFKRFLASGVNILHATAVNDEENMLPPRLPELCKESKALYAICLAFQTSLSHGHKARFFEYFDAALGLFRVELENCVSHLGDATLTAGLLLCSLGFMHGLPWTMHLQGMHNILQTHGIDHPAGRTRFRAHLLEVMGIMDLPTFTVGRQSPYIGAWRRYCRSNRWAGEGLPDRGRVEVVSGIPRSLIDLYSGIGEDTKEDDFWDWPGAEGTLLQCQLWEAFRLAGMLTLRRHALQMGIFPVQGGGRIPPKTVVLVSRILSCVDAIRRATADPKQTGTLIMNAIHYPVFIAGQEVAIFNENVEWKQLIRDCFTSCNWRTEFGETDQFLMEILEEMWELNDETVGVDELARARGLELGLM